MRRRFALQKHYVRNAAGRLFLFAKARDKTSPPDRWTFGVRTRSRAAFGDSTFSSI